MIPAGIGAIASANQVPQMVGGTKTTDGDYTVHRWTSTGTFVYYKGVGTGTSYATFDILSVAGGGGGGTSGGRTGGGGGAGGCYRGSNKYWDMDGVTVDIVVGGGGAEATNGNPTYFDEGSMSWLAYDGGHGGSTGHYASNGGSGGGAWHNAADDGGTYMDATAGNNGGLGYDSGNTSIGFKAGGGGGAGSAGTSATSTVAGTGGSGYTSSISGTSVVYSGGGGGGIQVYSQQALGSDGGGNGGQCSSTAVVNAATAGAINRGGGGGGGAQDSDGSVYTTGKSGGSGVMVIRYATNPLGSA